MIDIEHLNNLEASGIIDAYEYVLRKLVAEGLPEEKVYEKCATYLLEYEKVHLDKNLKVNGIKPLYRMTDPVNQIQSNDEYIGIPAKEILPTFQINLRCKHLLNDPDLLANTKVFETNIDEIIKKKIKLLSKNLFEEELKGNTDIYATFATFVENENDKIRMQNFRTAPAFEPYKFTTMLEIKDMIKNENAQKAEEAKYENNLDNKQDIDNMSVNSRKSKYSRKSNSILNYGNDFDLRSKESSNPKKNATVDINPNDGLKQTFGRGQLNTGGSMTSKGMVNKTDLNPSGQNYYEASSQIMSSTNNMINAKGSEITSNNVIDDGEEIEETDKKDDKTLPPINSKTQVKQASKKGSKVTSQVPSKKTSQKVSKNPSQNPSQNPSKNPSKTPSQRASKAPSKKATSNNVNDPQIIDDGGDEFEEYEEEEEEKKPEVNKSSSKQGSKIPSNQQSKGSSKKEILQGKVIPLNNSEQKEEVKSNKASSNKGGKEGQTQKTLKIIDNKGGEEEEEEEDAIMEEEEHPDSIKGW